MGTLVLAGLAAQLTIVGMRRLYLLLFALLILARYAVPSPARAAQQLPGTDEFNPTGTQASVDAVELMERVARSMGRYARDVSEIPLTVESTVSKFAASGKEKRSTSSHSMQFVRRSYGEDVVRRHLNLHKPGLHRVSRDEMNADSATGLLALAFDNGQVNRTYKYELITHVISKRVEVKFTDSSPCQAFDPISEQHERRWCGETHLLLDGATLDPISASFEAGGFPATFGDTRYLSFKFVEEFQKASIQGSSEPFLLPARLVATYESDRERTVIESKYSVQPTRGRHDE